MRSHGTISTARQAFGCPRDSIYMLF